MNSWKRYKLRDPCHLPYRHPIFINSPFQIAPGFQDKLFQTPKKRKRNSLKIENLLRFNIRFPDTKSFLTNKDFFFRDQFITIFIQVNMKFNIWIHFWCRVMKLLLNLFVSIIISKKNFLCILKNTVIHKSCYTYWQCGHWSFFRSK